MNLMLLRSNHPAGVLSSSCDMRNTISNAQQKVIHNEDNEAWIPHVDSLPAVLNVEPFPMNIESK